MIAPQRDRLQSPKAGIMNEAPAEMAGILFWSRSVPHGDVNAHGFRHFPGSRSKSKAPFQVERYD